MGNAHLVSYHKSELPTTQLLLDSTAGAQRQRSE